MPSLLHSRGALAGVGSAASLIAAAVVSLLFGAGLVAFTAWPSTSGTGIPSVSLPSAPAHGVPPGARGRAVAAVPAAAVVIPAAVPAGHRAAGRTVVGPVNRTGSASRPSFTPAVASTPPSAAAPAPAGGSAPPAGSVTRTLNSVGNTTTDVTTQAGAAVGGPVGAAVQSTGEQVAQTLGDVGAATDGLLGG